MSVAKARAAALAGPDEAPTPEHANVRLGVVIVYDGASAGKRALHSLEGVTHQSGGSIALHPSLWRFDLLEDPDWRAVATAEAVQAGLVVISTSSKAELPTAVRDWVKGWLGQSRGTAAALAALFGPVDGPDAADSPRLQFLKSAAEANGIGFFAPTPHAARHPPARRLSIWFNDSQPGGPVRINHTLARPSKPGAAIVRPQGRRPQSRQALRIVRPQRYNMNLENAASTQRRKGAETRVFHEKDRGTRKVERNEIRD